MSALHKGESGAVYMGGNVLSNYELNAARLAIMTGEFSQEAYFGKPGQTGECELCGAIKPTSKHYINGEYLDVCGVCHRDLHS